MYTNILIPVVLDEEHNTDKSYEVAHALAGEGAKFTIVHVIETIPAYASAEIPAGVLANRRTSIENALRKTAEALPEAEAKLIHGHAGQALVEYADKNNIDCIIVASHRPGLEDFFIGSTAARVVRHAKCSVHVIR